MADEELPPPSRNGDLRLPRSVSMQKDDYYNYVELMCEDGTCDAAVHAPRDRTCIERTRVSCRDARRRTPDERARDDRNPETLTMRDSRR
jgi:hypothetical protein